MSHKRKYLSASALKAFSKSPNHYVQYVTGTVTATPAMTFGSALHCFVLENDEFENMYAVAPEVDKRTKAGKEVWKAFVEGTVGREVLTQQDMGLILEMSAAIREHKPAQDLLEGCVAFEQMREGEIQGVQFKGIADGLSDGYILDIKTCQDASPEAFERTAFNSFYHEQGVAYQTLFNVDRFYWIAVEKNPPYNVSVFMQSEEAFYKARKHLFDLVRRWDNWDGLPQSYSKGVFTLNLPKWAK